MSELSRSERRGFAIAALALMPLFMAAVDFVGLYAAYRVLAACAPELLGAVARRPAEFAAGVVLVQMLIVLGRMLIALRGTLKHLLADDEGADPVPVRRSLGFKVRRATLAVLTSAVAALTVFGWLADPGDAETWRLVVLTTLGLYLIPMLLLWLFRLLGWCLRRLFRQQPRQACPDEQSTPDHPGLSPRPAAARITSDRLERGGLGDAPSARDGG